MQTLASGLDPGSLSAIEVFAVASLIITLALVGAGIMARKRDQKAAHFYLISAVVSGGVALGLIILSSLR